MLIKKYDDLIFMSDLQYFVFFRIYYSYNILTVCDSLISQKFKSDNWPSSSVKNSPRRSYARSDDQLRADIAQSNNSAKFL